MVACLGDYSNKKCRCDECRAEARLYWRRRDRARARPDEVWAPLVAVGPARNRIEELVASGVSASEISRATGVPTATLSTIRGGRTKRVSRRIHEKLMSLIPGCEAGPGQRPPVAAGRRTLHQDADELDRFFLEMLEIVEDRAAPWRRRAACRYPGIPPSVFFASRGGKDAETARQICAACPVRADCLALADAHAEQTGVWGGLPPKERRPRHDVAEAS